MSKQDKYVPWLGVIFAGLMLGALGRYIALQQTGDIGTANLTFVIVLGGVVFMYFLFIMLWESIHQAITMKKRSSQKRGSEQQVTDIPEETIVQTAFQQKINSFCRYSDKVLGGYVSEEDLARLHTYIGQYAQGNIGDIPQGIATTGLEKFELYHYGWNIWNHFRVVQQPETAQWLGQ